MNKRLLKLMYRSLDDQLSVKEQRKLDAALERSEKLQRAQMEAQRIRATLSSSERLFAPMFAERVVRTIKQNSAAVQDDFFSALNFMFRRVALASAIAVIVMFSIAALSRTQTSTLTEYAETQMTLDDLVDPTLTTSLEDLL